MIWSWKGEQHSITTNSECLTASRPICCKKRLGVFEKLAYSFLMMAFIFALGFLTSAQESQVVVAALAKVGDQVITSRDLQIHLFLNEIRNPLADFVDRKEPLKDLVTEYLIVREAEALVTVKVNEAEIDQEQERVLKKLRNDELWKALAVSQKELRAPLRRKWLVQQILNLKMPKDLVTVRDEAIESYYMQNKNQLGQRPLSEVRDKIYQILKNQKNHERFRDWVAALQRAHAVTYYSGYKLQ